MPERLPLFPLGLVMLPGLLLPLHVFEQRCRDLVRDLLELPEQVLGADPERTTAVLEQVRALGVRLALDRVGGRGSSLSAIAQLPLDVATLDSSLLLAAGAGDRPLALLEAVVGLTRRLGLLTVAEGVETSAQWELLARLGCSAARGPLVGPAVPAAAVPPLLSAGPLTA